MMPGWPSVVWLALKLLMSLTTFLQERKLINAGGAQMAMEMLQAGGAKADEIKKRMDDAASASTSGVPDAELRDPYSRD